MLAKPLRHKKYVEVATGDCDDFTLIFFFFSSRIAQNIAETCQKYFSYFIALKILSQHFCQILQHYKFEFLKHFSK